MSLLFKKILFCYVKVSAPVTVSPVYVGGPGVQKEVLEPLRTGLKPGHKPPSMGAMNCTGIIHKSSECSYIIICVSSPRDFVLRLK